MCNKIWKGEGWPEGWKEGEIIPLIKMVGEIGLKTTEE